MDIRYDDGEKQELVDIIPRTHIPTVAEIMDTIKDFCDREHIENLEYGHFYILA